MSEIDRLIAEHCPDGVEFKTLEEIARRNKGVSITAAKMKEINVKGGPIRVFAAGNTIADVPEDAISPANVIREPSVVVKSRGYIGIAFYDRPFTHKTEMWSYTFTDPNIDPKFMYHYLLTCAPGLQQLARATSVKLPQLSVGDTDRMKVPVPPLLVQRRISEVLDMMESLQSELQIELKARTRQYEHYRDQLLTFSERGRVKWATLSDISRNLDSRRRPVTRSAREPGPYPYYGASGVVDHVAEYIFDGDFLLISEDGANLLARTYPIAFSISGRAWVNNHAHVLEFDDYVSRRYVEIYLNSIDLSPYVSGASQPKLNKANLNTIPIPLPDSDEQARIVRVIDRFDALMKDLSFGLPAEIEARRKQYEYYRDKLLMFEERVA